MTTATFDTYEAMRRLQEAGLDEPTAKAVVQTVQSSVTDQVATKADLKSMQIQLMIWTAGLVGIATAILAVLITQSI